MPSKSKAQAKTMKAAANNKSFAEKADIPQSVAKEYVKADKAKSSKQKGSKR